MNHVLMLASETPGDDKFFKRWEVIGPVHRATWDEDNQVWDWDRSLNSMFRVIVVDQHISKDKFIKYIDNGFLLKFPRLQYVCSATTGHTHLKFSSDKIVAVTLRGETAFLKDVRSVAEFVFYLWNNMNRTPFGYGRTINGKTIGVVGYGRIGKHVAEIAKGYKMKVITYDVGNSYADLAGLFRLSDCVTLHLPETKATYQMIDSRLINMMHKDSALINTARPSILDEHALMEACKAKKISAAALDTTDLDWTDVENVIQTPHIAGSTIEDRIKTDEFIVEKTRKMIYAH